MIATDVLIIDDSKMITRLIAKILLSNKISNHFFHQDHIYIAYDGMQAIEMLSKHPGIKLLISDVMMPELSGNELVEMLIDTGKIKNLDVIFITTPINKNTISKKISENIKGVIYKPFSAENFCEFFNDLEIEHQAKIQKRKKVKSDHSKQMKHIRTWIQDYCEAQNIEIRSELLESLIADEFDHFYAIDEDEIYMNYQIILENYIKSINDSLNIENTLAQKIYNQWRHPQKYKALGIHENFLEIVSNAKTPLPDVALKDHIRHSIVLPLNRLLTKTRDTSNVKQKLPYEDFMPFLEKLADTFLEIDPNYKNTELLSALDHVREIEKFQQELKLFSHNANLTKTFAYLTEVPDLLEEVKKHMDTGVRYISQQIIPYYLFRVNELAWYNARKSSKIIDYLKNYMRSKMINTHNFLHQRGIIDRTDIKKFQKYEKEKVFLATRDLEVLELFKKKMLYSMPWFEITIFKSVSIIKKELEKDHYNKIMIDLSFTNSIFENGFLLAKLLNKKIQEFEKIAQRGGLYLIATPSQEEILQKSKIPFKYQVFLKPLDDKKIYQRFYLEN